RFRGYSRRYLLTASISPFDPSATSTPEFAATHRLAQLEISLGFDDWRRLILWLDVCLSFTEQIRRKAK
ncbi:MAG TPA: hypothetical protein VF396_03940, partial [Bradyrhizobium sp.]